MLLELRNVSHVLGGRQVLHDVDLDVAEGEIVALLGRSGVGKTTLLHLIAGFDRPSRAALLSLAGLPIRGPSEDIGIVVQSHALFPWLTLADNIGFGRRIRELAPAGRRSRVDDLLHAFGLKGMGHRYPDQLSLGQQQRGAVARALANLPRLLLADEPFGSLDALSREEAQAYLVEEVLRYGTAVLFVTHDVDEALVIADRIMLLQPGDDGSRLVPAAKIATPRAPNFRYEEEFLQLKRNLRTALGSERRPTPGDLH